MKLAVLMQCHKDPWQINRCFDVMKHQDVEFFVHVDRKSNILNDIEKRLDVHLVPDDLRVDVQWGTFSQVQATLNLINFTKKYGEYDYYFLISGQDYPIKTIENLLEYIDNNGNKNYIDLFPSQNNTIGKQTNYDKRNQIVYPKWMLKRSNIIRLIRRAWVEITGGYSKTLEIFKRKDIPDFKFYFGSSWWCLNNSFIAYVIDYISKEKSYVQFFSKACCPDESFFQTLIMNSPFADTVYPYLTYVDWTSGGSSPKDLTVADFDKIRKSDKYMARKINKDLSLMQKIDSELLHM